MLPAVVLDLPAHDGGRFAPDDLVVAGTRSVWLEIGFGGGEHLAAQAASHRDVTHLGVEPYLNGVAGLLARVEDDALTNVRVVVDDARLVLAALPDNSVERVTALFPDPWPKPRHHKRRIVNVATVHEFARVLAPGGELRLASDHPGYVTWMLAALRGQDVLRWTAMRASDWRARPGDWPPTRYEEKALAAGRPCVFLRFRAGRPEDAS